MSDVADQTEEPSAADDPPAEAEVDMVEAAVEPSPFATLQSQEEEVQAASFDAEGGDAIPAGHLDLVFDVPVCMTVELGRTEIPIRDVVNLGRGSIIELSRGPGTPLDVRVNGVLIGRGEVVLVNSEKLGLRFVEVVSQTDSVKRSG
jgi:flagellar motor switch protein FliN/FliY